ncbi:MAG: hypothetical protein ACKV0T_11080 [Planctomycetales bacterium]
MTPIGNVIEAIWKPDAKPNLSPSQVTVTVQSEDWLSFLKRSRKELIAAGAAFRRGIEIQKDIEQIRGSSSH